MSNNVKDDLLSKVSGGTGIGDFKYNLCDRDWVYDNSYKTITIRVEENISTNDPNTLVRVVKRKKAETTDDDGSGRINVPVSSIIDKYKNYGGQLHNM